MDGIGAGQQQVREPMPEVGKCAGYRCDFFCPAGDSMLLRESKTGACRFDHALCRLIDMRAKAGCRSSDGEMEAYFACDRDGHQGNIGGICVEAASASVD